jgi:prolyl-tRNA editing enzyme YbaK/EbsC (Cys-tRNA(Pro) deacylase)
VNVNGDDTFRNGTSDVTIGVPSPRPGAVAGASFTDAARNELFASVYEKTHALIFAVKNALDSEGSVVRPARPSLVRALAAVGGVEDAVSPETASPNIDGFSGSSARDAETRSTRVLVESAVRGAAACLAALGDVDDAPFEDETAKRSDTDDKIRARTKTRRFSMSTRRAVSHAILDALGPATRRNGCVGDAFAPHVAKVFETCLKGFIRRGTCEDEDEDSEKQERSFSEDPSDTQSVGTNLAFSGVCPRVAVRFAKILRVSPALASPFPGAATRMAEALSLAAVAEKKKESRSERQGEGVANENENENESFKSDTPASRAGAVAELLAWSGESASVPEALFVSLSQLCVDAGHASAAEVLLKTRVEDAHALRARLARTHADAGNHRAARRLAGESLLDELRRDAEEPFAFLPVSPNRVSLDEGVSKETTFCRKGVLASALGDSNESIVLAHDLHSVSRARALLDSAFSRERLSDPRRGQSHRLPTPIVGFDCEWRPGPGDASSNPVTVAQFAMHTGFGSNGHAVVVLDCASVFGPNASFELAAAATSFVKTVFETCLLCGFGVASDARRLAASYPDRFFSCSFGSDGSKQAHEENITVTTVCVRDVSITLGASAQTHASSLSNLCASVLGPNDALDKTEQVSGWDARPLRRSQILYAAYDALAPRCVLVTLLAKRAKRMFEGDVADACVPWTKKETLGAAFLQTLKEKTENDRDGRLGDFLSSTPPRTDADVRRALTRLGALTRSDEILADADADADADAAECLVMVEGWSTSSLKRTTLLCKTLAVVAESTSDGNVFLAATCVLPAFDSIRLDLAAAAAALLGVPDVSSPTPAFRLRLANANELHELFGFAAGSVGPFGLRDSVKSLRRLTVMDESLFVEENAKKTKLSCGSSLVAVGGGAPDVKVVGTAQAVAKHADASVARLTARNL